MPMPEKSHTINRLTMREEIYEKLLTWITEGILLPGEKLVDKALAEKMGVSRTPVREALRRLEDKGMVESLASRWTKVTQISKEEPGMVYPIIWTLEELVLSLAIPRMTRQDFKKMEMANQQLEAALSDNDPVAATRADAIFHDVFIHRSENVHLINILHDLKLMYRRMEILYFEGHTHATASVQEHKKFIAALEVQDIEQAQNILKTNWKNSLDRLGRI